MRVRFGWMGAGASLLVMTAGGCSSNAPGSSPEPTATAAQAIQNGTTDTTDTFAVGIYGQLPGGEITFCSGALILPNVVATARHCVSDLPSPQVDCATNPSFTGDHSAGQYQITTSTTMNQSSTWHGVAKIIRPTDAHICGNDIALMILDDVIPASEAKPIVPGVQYPMGDETRFAQRFEAIGYGATDSSGQTGVGTRRIHKNISVLCIPGDAVIDCPPDIGVSPREFIGGSGTCEGDSGSSAYDTKTFGTPTATSYGVLSRGGANGANCQDSIYTRFDAWRDLVIQAAQTASNNWSLYPKPNPDWTVFVPPASADGGTTSSSSGGPTQGSGAVGDTCSVPSDCSGGQCIDPGDGNLICSQSCDDSNPCPDGFDCSADSALCVPAAAQPQQTKSADPPKSGGCAVASGRGTGAGSSGGLGALGIALGLAIALRGRRRAP